MEYSDLPPTTIGNKTPHQKEFLLQIHIIKQHAIYFPHVLITAFPGRPGDAQDGFFKKLMGVKPGVSDILLYWKSTLKIPQLGSVTYSIMKAAAIELKVDARVSSSQNKWLSAFASCGGHQGVARSWQEYYKLLCKWGIKPISECTTFIEPDYRDLSEKYRDAHNIFAPVKD